jgi:hypothetical protein
MVLRDIEWVQLAQDMGQWQTVENAVMKLRVLAFAELFSSLVSFVVSFWFPYIQNF